MSISRIAAILFMSLALVSCGGGERPTDIAAREGIILIGNGGEPQTLDPHLATGNPENTILRQLVEGLTSFDPAQPNVPQPGVAESWEHNDDYTRWVFHLRDNARFTNGDTVTAQDFVYSWKRFLSPELGAQDSSNIYQIRNAEAFNLGKIDDFGQVGVKAVDDATLVVELNRPDPTFANQLSAPAVAPLSQRAIEAYGTSIDRQNPWTELDKFVGNGPFMLKDWRINEVLELSKNPDYWDADNVALNGARFYPIENLVTEERMFKSGRLHVTLTVPPDRVPLFIKEKLPSFVSEPALRPDFYVINVNGAPLSDVRVRQALSLAIDRKSLVERVTQGGELPATGFMPAGFADYPAANVLTYDVGKARKLLSEAGYPGGKGFPHFEIMINTSENHRKIAQAIQEMWRTGLGIDVGIYNQEWRVYLDSLLGGDFKIARAGLVANSPDIFSPMEAFTTDGSRNLGHWSNAEYDRLMMQARGEGDIERRNELLHQAELVMLTDMPVIPLFWGRNNFLLDPSVQGWTANPYGRHPLRHVSFKE